MQLSNFSIGKYEVTQALWEAVMGTNPSEFKKGKNYPVEEVSWEDCNKFIQKLNHVTGKYFRFPTEAEWEFAAKGGSMFNETNSQTDQILFESAWFKDNINNTSHPVGLKKPNIIGLYDMNGNVWEWCADWYSSYSNTLQINPCGPLQAMDALYAVAVGHFLNNICDLNFGFIIFLHIVVVVLA